MADPKAYGGGMDCSVVHDALARGAVGDEATAHAATCAPCAELLADDAALGRVLAEAVDDRPSPELRSRLAARLATERRGGPARWSTPVRGAALVAGLVALVVGTATLQLRSDADLVPLGQMVLVLGGLVGATLLGFARVLRPLHRPELPGWNRRLSTAVLAGLPLALMALPPSVPMDSRGVAPIVACFVGGSAFAALGLVGLRAFDRRPRVGWDRRLVYAGVGALLGTVYLQLHCADRDPVHTLLGHGTIAAAWMVGVALTARWRGASAGDRLA